MAAKEICLKDKRRRLQLLKEIQQLKDLDERILNNSVAHAAMSIHLLEDQLRLSPARIEGFKN